MDVKGAYLNRRLMEELFMKQLVGFKDDTRQACRLVKSIYGPKWAGNVWNHDLNSTMPDIHACKVFIALTFCETKKKN